MNFRGLRMLLEAGSGIASGLSCLRRSRVGWVRQIGWVTLVTVLLAGPRSAWAEDWAAEYRRLENGLRVVVIPNFALPLVEVQLWFGAGHGDDPSGQAGLCRAVHTAIAVRDARLWKLAALGGQSTAVVAHDASMFAVTLPAPQATAALGLLADMVAPEPPSAEELAAVRASSTNPLRVEDAEHLIERWFVAGNATLLIVGAWSPPLAFAEAQEQFGLRPWAESPRRAWSEDTVLPPQATVVTEAAGNVLCWPGPSLGVATGSAIDVLLEHLCAWPDGAWWRVSAARGLVPRWHRLAGRTDGTVEFWLESQATSAVPSASQPTSAVVPIIELAAELESIEKQGLSEQEFNRARALAGRTLREDWESFAAFARTLGRYEVVGGDAQRALHAERRLPLLRMADVQVAARDLREALVTQSAAASMAKEVLRPWTEPRGLLRDSINDLHRPGRGFIPPDLVLRRLAAYRPGATDARAPARAPRVIRSHFGENAEVSLISLALPGGMAAWTRIPLQGDHGRPNTATEPDAAMLRAAEVYHAYHGLVLRQEWLPDAVSWWSQGPSHYVSQTLEWHARVWGGSEAEKAAPDAPRGLRIAICGNVDGGEVLARLPAAWHFAALGTGGRAVPGGWAAAACEHRPTVPDTAELVLRLDWRRPAPDARTALRRHVVEVLLGRLPLELFDEQGDGGLTEWCAAASEFRAVARFAPEDARAVEEALRAWVARLRTGKVEDALLVTAVELARAERWRWLDRPARITAAALEDDTPWDRIEAETPAQLRAALPELLEAAILVIELTQP